MDSTPTPSSHDGAAHPPGGRTVAPLREGQMLFGRYRLVRELGRGGMGVVLRATDTELGVDMALKLVPDLLIHDEDALQDLREEVLRGMVLTHPGIVRTHGLVRDESMAAIVMEYVDGGTFHDLRKLQPGGCFEPAELLPWLEQLCPALDYAHFEIQLAHRDLKPRNLMYTHTGRIKVADFGISSNLGDSMTRVTSPGLSSGTPSYMSPQQIMGERPSHLDDIYALGATLFELLTGKPPFYQGDILYQVLEKEAPGMNEMRAKLGVSGTAEIPGTWERAVAACLAKSPDRRPPSASHVVEALATGEVIVTSGGGKDPDAPAGEKHRGRLPKKKRGAGWALAAVLAVAAAAGGTLLVSSRPHGTKAGQETHPLLIRMPDALPPAVAGSAYSHQAEAGGGSPPYRWTADGDGLPDGLELDGDGRLHGTPQSAAEYQMDFVVSDSASGRSTKRVSLSVTPPPVTSRRAEETSAPPLRWITPAELPSGMVGVPYRLVLEVEGGAPPYSWESGSASPPAGISLGEDGTLSGTPEQEFSGGFKVRVKDRDGTELERVLGLSILPRPEAAAAAEDDSKPAVKASRSKPFVNSIGMRFVPAGSEGVL
ncbi:MAG: serine/threonine protein kinase, partial [Verrucomicrobiae bacterium]|nr:serine/threonine protein kinase [Verrucomicrobiae bacterium]